MILSRMGPLFRLRDPGATWRIIAPLAVIYFILIACALFGLHSIAEEVDRSDDRRAGEAVTAAFNYHLKRLEFVTLNNAVYTEAWRAVGGAAVNTKWAVENWTVAPVGLPGHYGILLLAPDGRPIVGTRAGRPMTEPEMNSMARLVQSTLRKLPLEGSGSARGLVTTGSEPVFIAAANVVPEPHHQTSDVLAGPKRRLALIHPMNRAMIATMNETVGGDALRVSKRTSNHSVDFKADEGEPLVLAWRSREPGEAAKIRSLQIVVPILLLVTGLMIVAMRAGLLSGRALERAAHVDQLTQLNNRAAFLPKLEAALARARSPTLGLIDLDGFKQVNDTFGHHVGDDLLSHFAQLLSKASSPTCTVARLGGDEFAFVCENNVDAQLLISRLQASLSQQHQVGALLLTIGASVGTARASAGDSSRLLLAAADSALYSDKRNRRSLAILSADVAKVEGDRSKSAKSGMPSKRLMVVTG